MLTHFIDLIAEIRVRTSPTNIVAVKQDVTFQLARFRFDDVNETNTCYILFTNIKHKQPFDQTFELLHAFSFPGSHRFIASCYFFHWNDAVHTDGIIKVETLFNLEDLEVSFEPRGFPYFNDSVITFVHRFASPVNYSFAIGPHIFKKRQTRVRNHLRCFVEFILENKTKRSVGPGLLPFSLTLSNSLSSAVYRNNLSLNQDFKGVKITTERYVGVKPSYFFVNITLEEGAPVFISLRLRRFHGIAIETQITSYCPSKCDRIITKTQVEKGLYIIDASVYNDFYGASLFWGPFEALPQVYDVYLTSLTSVQVAQMMTVLVFIQSDLGRFVLELIHDYIKYEIPFVSEAMNYGHKVNMSLPFNPLLFRVVEKQLLFSKPGINRIKISVKNDEQTFTFPDAEVFVKPTLSCLKEVQITGIPASSDYAINVTSKLVLRANIITRCLERNKVVFEWKVFRVESHLKVPNLNSRPSLIGRMQEFVLDPNHIIPGNYVVIITVTTKKPKTYLLTNMMKKYLLVLIEGRKMNVFIEGGEIKEIGESLLLYCSLMFNNSCGRVVRTSVFGAADSGLIRVKPMT